MRELAEIRLLPDGRRLHLHDGPIDLIVEAFGAQCDIKAAYQAAAERFVAVLDELCSELALLRQPARKHGLLPVGVVAKRMAAAVAPYCEQTFITPMAAVAGAVAEEILSVMTSAAMLSRAYVNNGGDIGFGGHVAGEECVNIGSPLACGESVYLKDAATGKIQSIAHQGDPAPGRVVHLQRCDAWGDGVRRPPGIAVRLQLPGLPIVERADAVGAVATGVWRR